MRKIILATAFVLTSSVAFAAPFSAEISGDGVRTVGGFQTFAQCQAYVSGIGGTCTDNNASWTNAQARMLGSVKSQPVAIEFDNPHRP
jgi:hypothetical protein